MDTLATVLGMALAFILGAYIRQPFALKRTVAQPKEKFEYKPKSTSEVTMEEQYENLMKFSGKAQPK